jgi:hypothetical protein
MELKDLNQSQHEALLEYRKSKAALTEEEQEFIQKNYPSLRTNKDIVFAETVIDRFCDGVSSYAPYTPSQMIAKLHILIQRIENGEIVDVPAGTSVEKDRGDSYSEIYYTGNGHEFYAADTPAGIIREL